MTESKLIAQNGVETVELTGDAKQEFLMFQKATQEELESINSQESTRNANKESALSKLAALGLTEEEIAAL